jgi:hypothetical protein
MSGYEVRKFSRLVEDGLDEEESEDCRRALLWAFFYCVLAPARFATSLTSAVHRGCQNLYVRSTSAKVMAHWTASRCLNIPTDSVVHLSLPLILSAVDSARALL